MAVPTQKAFYRPVLDVVRDAASVVSAWELVRRVADRLSLTPEDIEQRTPSGAQTVRNRALWAVSYLRSLGLIANVSRGQLYITDTGKELLRDHSGEIDAATLRQLTPNEAQVVTQELEVDTPPDELMAEAHSTLRRTLALELLDNLQRVSWERFEHLCVQLLERMGYSRGVHLGQTGDGGIDGGINQDALGLERVYIQAKRWTNHVGEPEIRNFSGSLNARGAKKGVFITNSQFNAPAKQTASFISSGGQTIILVEGIELAYLMIDHGVGVITQQIYEVKKLDENYFAEDG